jgi:hypothetical protein
MKLPATLWLLPALHVFAAGADDSGLHTLAVAAEVTAIAVPPQPPDRHFFALPSLDYVFRIKARCHSDWEPESLSLSVADSRVTRSATELEGKANLELELKVPAKQLAPIAMRDFCVIVPAAEGSAATEPPDWNHRTTPGPGKMTIGAVMSVHVSLRCGLGDEQQTIYVSQPLDVTLTCAGPETAGGTAARPAARPPTRPPTRR